MASQTPPRTLEGKVAIVTGSSRGIGEVLAFDLASRGAKVAITYSSDRNKKTADELVKRIKTEAKSDAIDIQCDLQSADAPKQIVSETVKAFGDKIDILVNNAAVISDKMLQDVTTGHFDEVFHLNVRAPLLMLQAVLPYLRRPGRIINISSVGAREGFPGTGTYSASKAALEGYTRNWASELGKDGTTVNAVNPGPVQSEMLGQVDPKIVEPQLKATFIEQRVGKASFGPDKMTPAIFKEKWLTRIHTLLADLEHIDQNIIDRGISHLRFFYENRVFNSIRESDFELNDWSLEAGWSIANRRYTNPFSAAWRLTGFLRHNLPMTSLEDISLAFSTVVALDFGEKTFGPSCKPPK